MILHPIDTISNMASGIANLGMGLVKILVESCLLEVEEQTDFGEFKEHCERINAQTKHVYEAIKKKLSDTPNRDLIVGGTAILLENYLSGKCLTKMGQLFGKASAGIATVSNRLKNGEQTLAVAVEACCIEAPIVSEASETLCRFAKNAGSILLEAKVSYLLRKKLKNLPIMSKITTDVLKMRQATSPVLTGNIFSPQQIRGVYTMTF